MVERHHVVGFEEFETLMKRFSNDDVVFVLYSGSKLPNGESWCDDCVRAAPVIEGCLKRIDMKSHFVYVEVGDRPFWKDPHCIFRSCPQTKLMVLPTLVRWKGPQKLEGEQCEKEELVDMLFNDD